MKFFKLIVLVIAILLTVSTNAFAASTRGEDYLNKGDETYFNENIYSLFFHYEFVLDKNIRFLGEFDWDFLKPSDIYYGTENFHSTYDGDRKSLGAYAIYTIYGDKSSDSFLDFGIGLTYSVEDLTYSDEYEYAIVVNPGNFAEQTTTDQGYKIFLGGKKMLSDEWGLFGGVDYRVIDQEVSNNSFKGSKDIESFNAYIYFQYIPKASGHRFKFGARTNRSIDSGY